VDKVYYHSIKNRHDKLVEFYNNYYLINDIITIICDL